MSAVLDLTTGQPVSGQPNQSPPATVSWDGTKLTFSQPITGTAPTASPGTDSTQIATTAYADAAVAASAAASGWQGVWAIGTTYAKSAIVAGSNGHVYLSIAAANVGYDPTSDAGDHWQPLAA
jgi:hypothetical protein